MGQDWCRMRLRDDANVATVKRLIEKQALAWSQYEDIESDWTSYKWTKPDEREKYEREQAGQAYARASDELEKYLHIQAFINRDNETETPVGKAESMRIYGITWTPCFPRELRVRAYRSYLPSELASQLAEWKNFIDAVRAGEYRAFLLDWYLYIQSHTAKFFREELQLYAGSLNQISNTWAKRMLETPLPERIRAIPEPTNYLRPIWRNDKTYAEQKTDKRYIELWQTIDHIHTLRKEWTRKAPPKMKLGRQYFDTPTFEIFLQGANYADDLLAWLEQCVADGVGVYFYG